MATRNAPTHEKYAMLRNSIGVSPEMRPAASTKALSDTASAGFQIANRSIRTAAVSNRGIAEGHRRPDPLKPVHPAVVDEMKGYLAPLNLGAADTTRS